MLINIITRCFIRQLSECPSYIYFILTSSEHSLSVELKHNLKLKEFKTGHHRLSGATAGQY